MYRIKFLDKWFKKEAPRPTGSLAIEFGQDGLAISRLVASGDQWACPFSQFSHCVTQDEFQKKLHAVVEQYGLSGSSCHWVLHPNDYRLLLIDKPSVAPEEYNAAAQWLIKDLIDFSPEQAVIDSFLPAEQLPGMENKLYVVVARRDYLQPNKRLLDEAGLQVASITVQEMALRNVLMGAPVASSALLLLGGSRSSLMVVDNGQITLQRTINLGLRQIDAGQLDAARIIEEITRSLKYYTQQLRQAAPAQTFIAPLRDEYQSLAQDLAQAGYAEFDLTQIIQFSAEIDADTRAQAFCSIGAGLITAEGE